MKALVTGATGLVGRRLVGELKEPVVLSRNAARAQQTLGARALAWDGRQPPAPESLAGVDAVFHLAGEPIADGRWTSERKRRIEQSRVLGTRSLVSALEAASPRPRVLVSASAIGFYGDRADEELRESSPPGEGFVADVCRKWEAEARAAEALGVRVVMARLGLVLAAEGGALARMLPAFRWGVGGKLGSGRQWMSWVHLEDAVSMLAWAARDDRVSGPLNVTAPAPVTNEEFTRELGRACSRPTLLPVPRLGLRVALGELSELLLSSQRVLPTVALEKGHGFAFPELRAALSDCLRARAA